MLRFFRNIRQILIEKENFRKYFWYALGEILLVMIGILIALQVNNWNEERLIRQTAEYHFSLLKQDLNEDKRLLLELKNTFETDLKRAQRLLDIMKRTEISTDSIPVDMLHMILEYNFKPRNSGIDILVNSGGIGALEIEAQNLISQYYRSIDAVIERDRITNVFIQSKFEPHVYDNLTYLYGLGTGYPLVETIYKGDTRGPISIDIEKFQMDKKLEVLLVARYYQLDALIELYNIALLNLDNLNDFIAK